MLKRTPLKKGTSVLKKSPLKKVSKKKIERNEGQVGERWDKDREFYMRIWKKRAHWCFESDVYLGNEPLSTYFHHLLEKEKYPEFRHCEWNIVLVSFQVHDQVHMNIDKCPKIKKLTLELLQKLENGEV